MALYDDMSSWDADIYGEARHDMQANNLRKIVAWRVAIVTITTRIEAKHAADELVTSLHSLASGRPKW